MSISLRLHNPKRFSRAHFCNLLLGVPALTQNGFRAVRDKGGDSAVDYEPLAFAAGRSWGHE
jgi:hypothetical protein